VSRYDLDYVYSTNRIREKRPMSLQGPINAFSIFSGLLPGKRLV
jgi:hypothetical protein